MQTFSELMGIDLVKLEAERFGMTVDQARSLLTKKGTLRKRFARIGQPVLPQKIKVQPARECLTQQLNLTAAQERAYLNYVNYLKGQGK